MRYLKYAIGEIVLVVLGILIALQINDWNEERLERVQEREYLASMLSDLDQDRRLIGQAVEGNQVLLGRLDELLALLRQPPEQFEALIEEGEYLVTHDPALLIRYSNDVAFYKTTLNNTNLFLARQKELGDELASLIHEQYRLD